MTRCRTTWPSQLGAGPRRRDDLAANATAIYWMTRSCLLVGQ